MDFLAGLKSFVTDVAGGAVILLILFVVTFFSYHGYKEADRRDSRAPAFSAGTQPLVHKGHLTYLPSGPQVTVPPHLSNRAPFNAGKVLCNVGRQLAYTTSIGLVGNGTVMQRDTSWSFWEGKAVGEYKSFCMQRMAALTKGQSTPRDAIAEIIAAHIYDDLEAIHYETVAKSLNRIDFYIYAGVIALIAFLCGAGLAVITSQERWTDAIIAASFSVVLFSYVHPIYLDGLKNSGVTRMLQLVELPTSITTENGDTFFFYVDKDVFVFHFYAKHKEGIGR